METKEVLRLLDLMLRPFALERHHRRTVEAAYAKIEELEAELAAVSKVAVHLSHRMEGS